MKPHRNEGLSKEDCIVLELIEGILDVEKHQLSSCLGTALGGVEKHALGVARPTAYPSSPGSIC